jgi:hypothetical protein
LILDASYATTCSLTIAGDLGLQLILDASYATTSGLTIAGDLGL